MRKTNMQMGSLRSLPPVSPKDERQRALIPPKNLFYDQTAPTDRVDAVFRMLGGTIRMKVWVPKTETMNQVTISRKLGIISPS